MDTAPVDIMMIIIYTTRCGHTREVETVMSRLHGEIRKLRARGATSINVL